MTGTGHRASMLRAIFGVVVAVFCGAGGVHAQCLPIGCGETISGQISAPAETDCYQFAGGQGDVVQVSITGASGFFRACWTMRDVTGAPVPGGSACAAGATNVTLPGNGVYTIIVGDDNRTETGSYGLGIVPVSASFNGVPSCRNGTLGCGQTVGGKVAAGAQVDSYQMAGRAGDVIQVSITGASGFFKACWAMYDAGGQAVPGATACAAGATNVTLPADGLYTIIVADDNRTETGGYGLGIVPVSLTFNGAPSCRNGVLGCGQSVGGNVAAGAQADTYQTAGRAGNVVQVSITGASGFYRACWAMYDSRGQAVPRATACAAGATDVTLPGDGTYTLIVADDNRTETGSYGLGLSGACPPVSCGDGVVTPPEQCEPNQDPSPCAPGEACVGCACTVGSTATSTTTTTITTSTRTTSSTTTSTSTSTTTTTTTTTLPAFRLGLTFPKPPTPGVADELGVALATLGTTVVIGAPGEATAGAAFVIDGDRASPTFGSVTQTLTPPSPGRSGERFGAAVAVVNAGVLVGAPMDGVPGASGAAYVFNGSAVTPFVDPVPLAGDRFGAAVTALGANGVVGAPGVGRAFLFPGGSGTATKTFASPAPRAGDEFGAALVAFGSDLLVGAPGAGQAFLLDAVTGASKLVLQNPTPETGDRFGQAVAVVGTNLLVGAPGAAGNAGKAFLFEGASGRLLATFAKPIPVAGDLFGAAITALGPDVLVGAPFDGTAASAAGAAYRFDTSGNLLTTLLKPAPAANNHFGASVAALAGAALVGAPFDTIELAASGTAYLFDKTTLVAAFRKRLPAARFGAAVAALGTDVVAGAPGDGQEGGGRAYRLDGTTSAVRQTYASPAPSAGGRFGSAVAVSGTAVAIGAPFADVGGAAYLFDADTGRLLLTLNDPTPRAGDEFGYAVAATPTAVVVGAPLGDAGATDAGAVYVFDARDGSLLRIVQKPGPASGDFFGASLAVAGDALLVGAPVDGSGGVARAGAVYLYEISTGALQRVFRKPGAASGDSFGRSVVFVNGNVLVGAPFDDTGAPDAGAAYLFDGTSGALVRTFTNPTPGDGDAFGAAAAAVGARVLIAAPFDDTVAIDAGAAYLFEPATATVLATFLDPAAGTRDQFGLAVAAQGTSILVGAPGPSRVYRFDQVGLPLAEHFAPGPVSGSSGASSSCGNGIVDPGEQCDDGNTNDLDDCRNDCTLPLCCFILPATSQYCDDGNPCTDDSFDPSRGCVQVPNNQCCRASGECSTGETCRPCDGCFLYQWDCCDAGGATCLVPLTSDACAGLGDGVGCNDTNACTLDDACHGQTCTGAIRNCDDGRTCTQDTCNEVSGCINVATQCSCATDTDCDDNNPCTRDACVGGTCVNTPAPDGSSCGGGDLCSGLEVCTRGQCVHTAPAGCFDKARCACAAGLTCGDGRVPASISGPFEKACALIGQAKVAAAETTRPKKQRIGRARKPVQHAVVLFGQAGQAARAQKRKHKLSAQCAGTVSDTISHAAAVVKALRADLPSCTP